jgi:transglutaminase-like putative cysteine protease
MEFKVKSELEYEIKGPSTLIFGIQALSTSSQRVLEESLVLEPSSVKHDQFASPGGDSRFLRVVTNTETKLHVRYEARVNTQYKVLDSAELARVAVQQLEHDSLSLLFPSRYCQSDRLGRLAWQKFGEIPNAYERVVAITEWIHRNVSYESVVWLVPPTWASSRTWDEWELSSRRT